MSERMPVLTAAMAVAMSAKCDQLTAHAVEDMRVKAEELLPKGEALRTAIIAFATQYEADRRDQAAMAAHGEALQAALDLALGPEPVRVAPEPPPPEPPVRTVPHGPQDTVHHAWMDRKDIAG